MVYCYFVTLKGKTSLPKDKGKNGRKGKNGKFEHPPQWCLCFGYGAENKICSIKETQAFCFILFRCPDEKISFKNKSEIVKCNTATAAEFTVIS